jgi:hypothetical protein
MNEDFIENGDSVDNFQPRENSISKLKMKKKGKDIYTKIN